MHTQTRANTHRRAHALTHTHTHTHTHTQTHTHMHKNAQARTRCTESADGLRQLCSVAKATLPHFLSFVLNR